MESGVIVSVRQIHTYVAAFGKVTSHLLPLKKARRWIIVKSSTEPPFYTVGQICLTRGSSQSNIGLLLRML